MMIASLIALVVSATPTTPAAPPVVVTPRPSVAGAARGAAAMKALGMSDAGIAVLRRQSAPDPDAKALLAKRQALRAKLAEAAAATPFDVDAFAALLRDSSTLEQSVRARSEERIVTTLKALPAADRPIFAKAVFGGPGRAACPGHAGHTPRVEAGAVGDPRMADPVILWFRQDLRLADQAALIAAAGEGPVVPVYVLDDTAPGDWRIGGAQRWWLHHSLAALAAALEEKGAPLILRRGDAAAEVAKLAKEVGAARVHALHHYEPWWQAAEASLAASVDLCLHDGTRLIPPDRVRTGGGGRYRMFSAFWKALKEQMPPQKPLPAPDRIDTIGKPPKSDALADWKLLPTAPDWSGGFSVWTPGEAGAQAALDEFLPKTADYDVARNLPSQEGTSRFSPHLHHGELSPATVWHAVSGADPRHAEPFLRELAWRDFTGNVIDQFGDYADGNGRPAYDAMPWREGAQADADFAAWTKGRTGYPIVDAGMRQLWATGWMHNRVRMIAASFVIKHLLIDWRRGEAWYWDALVDADYGNNSVNWQWVAGTGIDSNPFGRIMAPLVQSPKFDTGDYIREWVPELAGLGDDAIHDPHGAGKAPRDYPAPLIGHREARARALDAAAKVR